MTPYSINRNYRYFAALIIFFVCAYAQPHIKALTEHIRWVPAQLVGAVTVVVLIGVVWAAFNYFYGNCRRRYGFRSCQISAGGGSAT